MRLTGKGVLVTGGGSGIGLAVARLVLDEGAKVAITRRNEAKLKDAAATLQGGDRLVYHAADLGDAAQVKTLVERVTAKLGSIDVLVNNAGVNVKERTFHQLTPESWQDLVSGNLDS